LYFISITLRCIIYRMIFVSSLPVRVQARKASQQCCRLVNKVPSLKWGGLRRRWRWSRTPKVHFARSPWIYQCLQYCQLRFTPETALNNMGLICYTSSPEFPVILAWYFWNLSFKISNINVVYSFAYLLTVYDMLLYYYMYRLVFRWPWAGCFMPEDSAASSKGFFVRGPALNTFARDPRIDSPTACIRTWLSATAG
jgi:hypothetical protein